jgi:hypothetical protein
MNALRIAAVTVASVALWGAIILEPRILLYSAGVIALTVICVTFHRAWMES